MKKCFRKIVGFVLALVIMTGLTTGFEGTLKTKAAIVYSDTGTYDSLADEYADYFKIGVAIPNWNYFSGTTLEAKQKAVLDIFNSVTCENEMKPEAMFSPTADGLFKVSDGAVAMLVWAKANGMKLRGHTLVWHSQVNPAIFAKDFKPTVNGKATTSYSDWLDDDCLVDRDTLIERLKTYIYSVMEYVYSNGYGDVIYAWDVVNEAMDEGQDDCLRRSTWYRILGPDFLYYSFLFAREATVKYSEEYASLYGLSADSDLSSIRPKLFYNDYNEWFANKRDGIIKYAAEYKYNENQKLVKSSVIKKDGDGTMLGDGLIDGIGMQGHISDNQDIPTFITALKKYSEAVGEVHITELDVGCNSSGPDRWLKQAKYFYDFFNAILEAKKEGANLTCVTLWGLSDDSSWRGGDDPLLLNSDLSMKPAYKAVVMAARGEEFDLTLAQTITELKDEIIDFEPNVTGNGTESSSPREMGFIPLWTGSKPMIGLKMKINHTPDQPLGFSLEVSRSTEEAYVKYDISKFCGRNITVSMYVQTKDNYVTVGFEGEETILANKACTPDEWTFIRFNVDVPDASEKYLYIKTDGKSDFYVDDIEIVYTKEGETAPVIDEADYMSVKEESTITANEPESEKANTDEVTEPVQKEENASVPAEVSSKADSETGSSKAVRLSLVLGIIAIIFAVVVILYRKRKK